MNNEKLLEKHIEEAVLTIGSPILQPIGIVQGIFILALLSSPFIWIWVGWGVAWKVGLTGIIGTVVLYFIYSGIKRVFTEEVKNRLRNTK